MSAPKQLNALLYMHPSSQRLQGLYHGNPSAFGDVIQPLLEALGTELSYVKEMDWIQSLQYFSGGKALEQTYPYAEVSGKTVLSCTRMRG